jgi:hypothetical protein
VNRCLTIALVVFQAAWLNVMVPGHSRGAVVVPGWDRVAQAPSLHGCCPTGPTRDNTPTPGDRAHCAVCFFVAQLSTPPAIDLTPPPLALVEALPPECVQIVHVAATPLPFDGRGPPNPPAFAA